MAQPVHWQSAFWGLASLALNSAVQDSGRVLGLPTECQLALKTSPLVCLFDAIHTLFSVAQQCRHRPLRSSLQSVAAVKGVHSYRGKNVKSTEGLLSIVVSVAALLQLIKLSGLSGIPWTQAFGAFYFVSYIIQEILFHFGSPTHSGGPLHQAHDTDVAEYRGSG